MIKYLFNNSVKDIPDKRIAIMDIKYAPVTIEGVVKLITPKMKKIAASNFALGSHENAHFDTPVTASTSPLLANFFSPPT